MGRIPYSGLPAHRLLFYTIGRVPSRIHTILHSGFVLRQPPPHHIHASEFSQARWYPDQPRNFTALRRYVGRIRSSLQSRCQPINKFRRPAAFVQRTGKTTFAGLRSVRLRGKRSRLWCRQQDLNLRTRKFFISELYPPSFCLHIAPSGRSRSPAHQEKKGEKKKDGDAEFAPASSIIKCVFSIFPLLSGIFKNYFSAISTTQG